MNPPFPRRPDTAAQVRAPTEHYEREILEAAAEALLDAVEAILTVLDDLEGDPDKEPSLGAPERHPIAGYAEAFDRPQCDQRQWAQGDTLDQEEQHDAEPDLFHDCTWQDEGDQTRLIGQLGVLVVEGPTPHRQG